jgi:hypothetical protein
MVVFAVNFDELGAKIAADPKEGVSKHILRPRA